MSYGELNIDALTGGTLGGRKAWEDFRDAAERDVDFETNQKISEIERDQKREIGISLAPKYKM